MLTSVIRNIFDAAGLEVRRKEDPYRLALYERIFDRETLGRKPFYNVGSGTFQHPYWTSIDYDSEHYGRNRNVVHHDLMAMRPLPIDSGSAKIIYTSHTIEHVTDEAGAFLFADAFRALEPGGIFRITTGPDAETDFRALQGGDADWFYWDEWYDHPDAYKGILRGPATKVPLEERWLHHVFTALAPNSIVDHPNKQTAADVRSTVEKLGFIDTLERYRTMVDFNSEHPENHVTWWTHAKIEQFLKRAGFSKIYRSGYRQSISPLMRQSSLFDSTHPQMSIYMEAIR